MALAKPGQASHTQLHVMLGAWEIACLVVVALVVLGPERLPQVARSLARLLGQIRHVTDEVRRNVEDAMVEPQAFLGQDKDPKNQPFAKHWTELMTLEQARAQKTYEQQQTDGLLRDAHGHVISRGNAGNNLAAVTKNVSTSPVDETNSTPDAKSDTPRDG